MRMHGEYKVPGGKLVVADVGVRAGRLDRVQISGDFFLEPASALEAINAALVGMDAAAGEAAYAEAVGAVLAGAAPYGITAEGVAIAVTRALAAGAAP